MFDEEIRTALEDLNLHCTDHAPDADCEGCRLQLRGMRFVDLEGSAGGARDEADARERDAGSSQSTGASVPLSAIRALVEEMRSIARVAGQCSVEGPEDVTSLMAAAEAERAARWADQLAALCPAPPEDQKPQG